ncbi:HIT domain-containing protein, partial [Klebsiella pneumoniae]|nr:HIT domain-containing protein [Klebsiella pneumoniae]
HAEKHVPADDELALGRMGPDGGNATRIEGLGRNGCGLRVTESRHGGQEVYHIHMHLLGGRPLGPMLAHKG